MARFPNTLSLPTLARSFLCLLALVVGAGFFNQASAADNMNTQVQSAVDNAMTQADPGTSKLEPVQTQTNQIAGWLITVLWVFVPMILFGSLVAWGVWQAKQNEMSAAWKTFAAVGIGAIFYFGVLTIFT